MLVEVQLPVYNIEGEIVDQVELADSVFGVEPRATLMHQAVVAQLANARQGTASTKRRGEVRGGGRKPWRQKGTGRARQGSRRAPHWRGGGITFGPKPRDYRQRLNHKARRLAIRCALSAKVRDGRLLLLNELHFEEPKTKAMVQILDLFAIKSGLVVLAEKDENVIKSARNIPKIDTLPVNNLSIVDLLRHEHLIMPLEAVRIVEGLWGEKAA